MKSASAVFMNPIHCQSKPGRFYAENARRKGTAARAVCARPGCC
jgi:hypothetical protein